MKKRGGTKHSSGRKPVRSAGSGRKKLARTAGKKRKAHAPSRAKLSAKARISRKTKHAKAARPSSAKVKHVSIRKHRHSKAPGKPSVEVSAARIVAKEERAVKKELKWLFGPQEFHVVTFVTSLLILALLLRSTSMIFYSVLTIGALLFAHFLKQHHRPHDIITIIGLFFLPLAFTLAAFRDAMSILLLIVYLIAVISTIIIYYYHKKVHTPLKIMWQVTYSKIIAITLALIVACLLPFIFPDAFLSIFELIFIFVLPIAFVFFFASKFFYLYFFDRIHIRADLKRSLRFTVIYTLAFIVIVMCIYSLFAAGFYNSRSAKYSDSLDTALLGVSSLESSLIKQPREMQQLMVMKDLEGVAAELRENLTLEKSLVVERAISFEDILDDSYFATLSQDSFNTLRFVVWQVELYGLKRSIYDAEQDVEEMLRINPAFANRTKAIDLYAEELKSRVDAVFTPYSQDPDLQDLVENLNDPSLKASFFEEQGFFYWFAEETGLEFVYGSKSIVSRQLSFVLRHTKNFKSLAQLTVNAVVFIIKESGSPVPVERLYANRDVDVLPMSKAIRYTILDDTLERREKAEQEASRISFKVD
jgi:hypothetical protein